MSRKTASVTLAAFALALTVSSAFAQDVARNHRHAAQWHESYNARASAERSDWIYGAPEPFTAAEKRAFQTPTGHEVDGW